jgi:hypothetical protein
MHAAVRIVFAQNHSISVNRESESLVEEHKPYTKQSYHSNGLGLWIISNKIVSFPSKLDVADLILVVICSNNKQRGTYTGPARTCRRRRYHPYHIDSILITEHTPIMSATSKGMNNNTPYRTNLYNSTVGRSWDGQRYVRNCKAIKPILTDPCTTTSNAAVRHLMDTTDLKWKLYGKNLHFEIIQESIITIQSFVRGCMGRSYCTKLIESKIQDILSYRTMVAQYATDDRKKNNATINTKKKKTKNTNRLQESLNHMTNPIHGEKNDNSDDDDDVDGTDGSQNGSYQSNRRTDEVFKPWRDETEQFEQSFMDVVVLERGCPTTTTTTSSSSPSSCDEESNRVLTTTSSLEKHHPNIAMIPRTKGLTSRAGCVSQRLPLHDRLRMWENSSSAAPAAASATNHPRKDIIHPLHHKQYEEEHIQQQQQQYKEDQYGIASSSKGELLPLCLERRAVVVVVGGGGQSSLSSSEVDTVNTSCFSRCCSSSISHTLPTTTIPSSDTSNHKNPTREQQPQQESMLLLRPKDDTSGSSNTPWTTTMNMTVAGQDHDDDDDDDGLCTDGVVSTDRMVLNYSSYMEESILTDPTSHSRGYQRYRTSRGGKNKTRPWRDETDRFDAY